MEMNVLEQQKIVEIWLTNAEKNDRILRKDLEKVYAKYKNTPYTVVVYESGEKDLFSETLALLSYNRKRMAEKEVRRAREAREQAEKPSVLEKLQTLREKPDVNLSTKRPERAGQEL